MTNKKIQELLDDLTHGRVTNEELYSFLSSKMSESIGFAEVDHHREFRQGFPEVILCEGKTAKQVAAIAKRIVAHGNPLLATRALRSHFNAVRKVVRSAKFNETSRTITANDHLVSEKERGTVLIVTAGTSDLSVAEEAMVSSRMMGNKTELLVDVGVAGIHRILNQNERLKRASVIIVVAGMEGALPSVVGGLVSVPVIAVPTSVGYGASFGGVAALLGMLNSCASGVTVVNIDNGFGAAFAANRINSLLSGKSITKPGMKTRRHH
jgi:pyridinium-3,5-biscarboxylic acid mononucleotide synthase